MGFLSVTNLVPWLILRAWMSLISFAGSRCTSTYPASRGYIFAVWDGVRKVACYFSQAISYRENVASAHRVTSTWHGGDKRKRWWEGRAIIRGNKVCKMLSDKYGILWHCENGALYHVRMSQCCVDWHHWNVLGTLSLLLLATVRLHRKLNQNVSQLSSTNHHLCLTWSL